MPPTRWRYNNRGNAYANRRDFDRAIADLSQAIKFDPAYAQAYDDRGVAFAARGDIDRALADFDAGDQIRRRATASPIYNRGLAYRDKNDLDRAIKNFDEAIKTQPEQRGGLLQPRQRAQVQARLRPRHRRLRPVDQARSRTTRPPITTAR